MSNLYRGPSIDVSYQVTFHLTKQFQRRIFFRNQPIRNKNCLWRTCLLTDQDVMSNSYRGNSIDASYQVSVHLAKRFQRRRFKKKTPIWNKNCLWRPYMLMDRDKMCNLYREPSIDVSYQVPSCGSFGSGVSEENIKMWKVNGWQTMDDRRQTTDAKWWQKLTLPLARWANKNVDIKFSNWIGASLLSHYTSVPVIL
jgi:hypothetical protein